MPVMQIRESRQGMDCEMTIDLNAVTAVSWQIMGKKQDDDTSTETGRLDIFIGSQVLALIADQPSTVLQFEAYYREIATFLKEQAEENDWK